MLKRCVLKSLRYIGARFLKPQRVMTLTMEEERLRAEATWQHIDYAMWGMLCSESFRQERFSRPDQVRDMLRFTSMLFSDQVPFWVKIVPGRQLFGEAERRRHQEKNPKDECMSQKVGALGMDEAPGKFQTRGQGMAEQEKFRVTLEMTHCLENYWDEEREPVGRMLPSLLVLAGTHARLSNLDDEGNFLKDEVFVWRGKEVLRRAGSSARRLMEPWVKLRICDFQNIC